MERRFGRTGIDLGGGPTPHELRAFVRLAEHLHFGRTARALGLAQSSLSEAIRRLEAKLDVVLFERTSRRVALTAAGARLLPRANEVLRGFAAVEAAAAVPREPTPGMLRIGLEVGGFEPVARPILEGFRAEHPETGLVLRELVGIPEAFFDADLDAALVCTPLPDERLVVHPIATVPRGVAMPADHPAAGTEGGSMRDFLDEPFVAITPHVPSTRDFWLGVDARDGVRPRIGGAAYTAREVAYAILHLGLMCTVPRHGPPPHPLQAGMGVADVSDLAPVTLGVAVRAHETRPIVDDLVELVRQTVAEHADEAGLTLLAAA